MDFIFIWFISIFLFVYSFLFISHVLIFFCLHGFSDLGGVWDKDHSMMGKKMGCAVIGSWFHSFLHVGKGVGSTACFHSFTQHVCENWNHRQGPNANPWCQDDFKAGYRRQLPYTMKHKEDHSLGFFKTYIETKVLVLKTWSCVFFHRTICCSGLTSTHISTMPCSGERLSG